MIHKKLERSILFIFFIASVAPASVTCAQDVMLPAGVWRRTVKFIFDGPSSSSNGRRYTTLESEPANKNEEIPTGDTVDRKTSVTMTYRVVDTKDGGEDAWYSASFRTTITWTFEPMPMTDDTALGDEQVVKLMDDGGILDDGKYEVSATPPSLYRGVEAAAGITADSRATSPPQPPYAASGSVPYPISTPPPPPP